MAPSLHNERDVVKLFIAIPSFDGKLTLPCAEGLLKAVNVLRDEGHQVVPYFHSGNVYIAAARNICVHIFLQSDCSDLVFIDSDVGFDKDAISKLLVHDKDIIAGIYPLKHDSVGYPMTIKFNEQNNCKEEETGLVYAEMVPTGFMRIKRSVFERMAAHYDMKKTHEDIYSFFDTGMVFEDDNTWYGEDIVFCKRWIDMGGEMFIEPRINFTHTGTKHWKGNFHEYLMGRSVAATFNAFVEDGAKADGWATDKELAILSELASKSRDVVEVGSWKGKSTKALLDSCKGTVYAVDHWKGSVGDVTEFVAEREDVFKQFFAHVGHYKNLEIMRGSSLDMVKCFNGSKVDMVYIDATHTYEAVRADIEAWLPKASRYICGHDYSPELPGVMKAVNEKFEHVNLVDRIWWVDLGTQK